jgi:hypothetical protein
LFLPKSLLFALYNLTILNLGEGMNTTQLIRELEAKRASLEAAIEALRIVDHSGRGKSGNGRRKKRYVSAEARKRMSDSQKKRWAAARRKKKK